jgi:hypothetical protein
MDDAGTRNQPREPMSPRARVLSFGSAILAIVLGGIIGRVIGGVTGDAVAIGLVALGGIAVVSLVFLEVGLSEDRDRAREEAQRRRARAATPRLPRRRRPG